MQDYKKKPMKISYDKKEPAKVTETMKVKDLGTGSKGVVHSPIKNG